jgi:hypothetical protein
MRKRLIPAMVPGGIAVNLITEKRRALLLLSSLLCAAAVVASPAAAPGAAEPSAVLGTSTPSLIAGPEEQDQLGGVQNAGDVNWDGRDDLLVVAYRFDGVGSEQVSKAYVIFGNGTDASVDLANLGDRGFVIDGPIEPVTSFNAAPGGDINGDGLADIIVGDAFATAAGRTHGGRVFVVFGKTDTDAVDVNTLGQGGYEIIGSQAEAFAISTSNVEDLNADGRDELLINEQGLDRATVLYGKATSSTVDLGSIGAGGYRIAGPASPGLESANRVGDVNGDGIDDLGFSGGCGGGSCSSGRTWVSFGKSDTNPVDLSSLGSGGFVITGNGEAGVEGAGDVNGDGKADIAVSDYNASRAFVAFGRTATSALSFDSLGTAGFRVSSTRYAGPGIKAIGDVDGDGLTDLLTTTTVGVDEFSAAVIFGKADGAAVDAANVLDKGFQIHGGLTGGGAATGTFASAPRIAVAFPDDSPLGRKRAGSVRLIAPPAPSFELPAELVYSAGSDISPVTPTNERRASKILAPHPLAPSGHESFEDRSYRNARLPLGV